MMKDILSAHSPHAILLAWNKETQVAITMNQKKVPIAENITSEDGSWNESWILYC